LTKAQHLPAKKRTLEWKSKFKFYCSDFESILSNYEIGSYMK